MHYFLYIEKACVYRLNIVLYRRVRLCVVFYKNSVVKDICVRVGFKTAEIEVVYAGNQGKKEPGFIQVKTYHWKYILQQLLDYLYTLHFSAIKKNYVNRYW